MDSYGGGRYEDSGERGDRDKRGRDARDDDYYERRRRRSRSRERDYSRRRDRSRSRERRREEDREDRYHSRRYDEGRKDYGDERGSYRGDKDSYDDRERDRDYRERKRWEERERKRSDDYRSDDRIEPGPVVMLRNLREDTRKEDLSRAIGASMSYVRDIRLIQRRDGSNGFAFVEFYETQDAVRWMEDNKDNFEILGTRVNMEYSRHRKLQTEPRDTRSAEDRDWVCFKCGTMNFARRRLCMTCDCPRSESESLHEDVRQGRLSDDHREADREENNPPSNVLILKGLDALSTEVSVRQAVTSVCALSLKDIRLIKDKVTNTSRGFCFVELNNMEDAKELLEKLQNQYPAFFVDGRRVSVNYARQNISSSSSKSATTSVASAAIAQAQWSMVAQQKSGDQQQSSQTAWQQTVQQQQDYGRTQLEQASRVVYSSKHNSSTKPSVRPRTQERPPLLLNRTSSFLLLTLMTLPLASTMTQQQDSTMTRKHSITTTVRQDNTATTTPHSRRILQLTVKVTQLPPAVVPQSLAPQLLLLSVEVWILPLSIVDTKKKKSTTTTVTAGSSMNAKKIAKDMERWAKNVNAAKASQQQQLQAIIQLERAEAQAKVPISNPTPVTDTEGFKRTGIALSAALESEDDRSSLSTHAVEVGGADSGPPPLPQGADVDPAHTDWSQLACLLCKRKFPSRDVLIKHQQLSELHKQNLEKERNSKSQLLAGGGSGSAVKMDELKYRDRAKERREKYGSPAIIPGWKRRLEREIDKDPPVPYEQPTREGIGQDNIGNKMLQAMGWNEGQGLGKANQGITKPIEAKLRQASAGLGSRGSNYGIYSAGGSYKETLKNLTKVRYEETFLD